MPTHHSRKPSGQQHSHNASSAQTTPSTKHQRTFTEPSPLLRLPSTSSAASVSVSRSRRLTNPSTPTTLTPSQVSTATTSPSYFSPQYAASGKDVRSPAFRKPPASHSGHGIDTSQGPPVALITRRSGDTARRPSLSQSTLSQSDYAHLQQFGLESPGTPRSSSGDYRRRKGEAESAGSYTPQSQHQTRTPSLSRQNSTRTAQRPQHMASSVDGSSDYDSARRSQSEYTQANKGRRGATDTSGTDGEQGEDLFLHIAEDNAAKESAAEAASRADRLRSRIARASTRQSFPSNLYSSSPAPPSSSTPVNGRRIPSSIDTRTGTPSQRRNSLLPSSSRTQREQTPLTPTYPLDTPRSRLVDQSPQPPVSSSPKPRDSDLSPRQFLSQLERRRPSYGDAVQTPPSRAQTFRPSNLQYSSSRDNQDTLQAELPQQGTPSKVDGTESLDDSTGPAASVWDELDDLKSRIRRIELGGKIPTTSGAVVANATTERPRTANTSITTVSSSPKQQRKTNTSPPGSAISAHNANKAHPVLREALTKVKQYVTPAVYRVLEATASEAIALAEMTGSAGPQGTLHSASLLLNGASDRQVRRKADSLCRSLTELCIELCDTKSSAASPALRTVAASNMRRPSVQLNGESPTIRQSIEIEEPPRNSPSRAMDRIQARRTSMYSSGINGGPRDSSQEPLAPSQSDIPTRVSRAGTSLLRARRTGENDDDDEPIMRAPSRALTDFRDLRAANPTSRFTREYTSREPMPDLQPSPALQTHTTSLRRPTVTGTGNENLLFRPNGQRYTLDRQNSPAYEKQVSADLGPRSQYNSNTQYNTNRNSTGGATNLGRTASLGGRRLRGTGAGE